MIYTRRRSGDAHMAFLSVYFCIFLRSMCAKCNLVETREPRIRSIAWISNRDRACQRKNEFFFLESIKTNTWCEFRAAIFVGIASENQLNGNNESLCMSSEVHTCCNRATRSCVRDDPARIFKSVHTKLMSFSCEFLLMILEQNCFEELHEIR